MIDIVRLSDYRAALKGSSVWGEAVQCAVGDELSIRSHDIVKGRQCFVDNAVSGGISDALDYGRVSVGGSISSHLRYDGLDLPLALAMGQSGGVPVRQGQTNAYAQTFTPVADTARLMATLALSSGADVHEYPSVKFTGLRISGSVGEAVQADFDCIADDLRVDSSVNTTTSMAAIKSSRSEGRVMMSHGVFRINAASGSALGAGDIVHPSSFALTLSRPMSGAYTAGRQDDGIDEPLLAGACECRLKMTFARHSDNSRVLAWDKEEASKMDLIFTGAYIEDEFYERVAISLPHIAPVYAGVSERDGRLIDEVEFVCLTSDTSPLGMASITAPFVLQLINSRSTDVLG